MMCWSIRERFSICSLDFIFNFKPFIIDSFSTSWHRAQITGLSFFEMLTWQLWLLTFLIPKLWKENNTKPYLHIPNYWETFDKFKTCLSFTSEEEHLVKMNTNPKYLFAAWAVLVHLVSLQFVALFTGHSNLFTQQDSFRSNLAISIPGSSLAECF